MHSTDHGKYDDAYFKKSVDELIEKVRAYCPAVNAARIREAFEYARTMHGDQKRESGEPFVNHPLMVATILSELNLDESTIIAALLHDCIEDTGGTHEEIARKFSHEVAQLVEGVTKLESMEHNISKDQAKAESLRKMLIAMSKDLRVVIIKLADRLHNMRTLRYRNENKRVATARETLEVYAPLAHRLGIYKIKWELEDLSLRFKDPHTYYELMDMVAMKRDERQAAIDRIISVLKEHLKELNVNADIDGRPKHFYSIYRKMQDKNLTFDQVYDLIAVRVVVSEVRDCYTVLGTVHNLWTPFPGRFKDYIAMPKPNLYQSLHSTVISDKGLAFEVQIRTREMHRIAEYGVAAHWRYKEGTWKNNGVDIVDARLAWIRQLSDANSEVNDATEFVDMLKIDLFSDEVFIFTPKGDVINLPRGSTPLDFAYRIHSDVGNRCVGAMINSKIVPLDTELETGNVVEIRTSPSSKGPSMDWLKIVRTTHARSKIRSALKSSLRDQNILVGRELLETEAKRQNVDFSRLIRKRVLEVVLKRLSLASVDDLCAAVGFGGLSATQVIVRLNTVYQELYAEPEPAPETPPAPKEERQPSHSEVISDGVTVRGMANMLVRIAQCCSPVPGDQIIGYTTRGRGVSVHRVDCVNVISYAKNPIESARLIDVSWASAKRESYKADVKVIAYSHPGLIGNVINVISQQGVAFPAFNAREDEETGKLDIAITLEIKDVNQLDVIIRLLNQNPNVIEVYRGG